MGFDYQCTFNLDDCLKRLGLNEKGRVQRAIDKEFLRGVEPFTPMDEGALYDSAIEKTIIGSGVIIFDVEDKARNLYYHPEYNFNEKGESETGGVGRGAYWAARYIQNGGREEIEKVAREAVRK